MSQPLSQAQSIFLDLDLCRPRGQEEKSRHRMKPGTHLPIAPGNQTFLPLSLERLDFGPPQTVRSQSSQLNGKQNRVSLMVQSESHPLMLLAGVQRVEAYMPLLLHMRPPYDRLKAPGKSPSLMWFQIESDAPSDMRSGHC